jgi:hypothetical protein
VSCAADDFWKNVFVVIQQRRIEGLPRERDIFAAGNADRWDGDGHGAQPPLHLNATHCGHIDFQN